VVQVQHGAYLCQDYHPLLPPHPRPRQHGAVQAIPKAGLTIGSPEENELYWYLLELFTEHDDAKDGIVTMIDFPAMLDRMLETPKKLAMVHPEEVGFCNLSP